MNKRTRPTLSRVVVWSGTFCVILVSGLVDIYPSFLLAQEKGGIGELDTQKEKAAVSKAGLTSWKLARGDRSSQGVSQAVLGENLKLLWKVRFKESLFEATPIVAKGRLYLPDLDNKMICLDAKTGETIWEKEYELGFNGSVSFYNDHLYIGDIDGKFLCIEAKEGEIVWQFQTDGEIAGGANFYKESVLFCSQDSLVYALSATDGKLLWKYETGDQIQSTPTIVGKDVIVTGCDGKLHILGIETGQPTVEAITYKSPTGVTPAVYGDFAYFGTEEGEFVALDIKTGKKVWDFVDPQFGQPIRSSASVTEKSVFYGGHDKRIRALDRITGKERWQYVAKQSFDASPILCGDYLYIGGNRGRLLKLHRQTGKKEWEYQANGDIPGSVAIIQSFDDKTQQQSENLGSRKGTGQDVKENQRNNKAQGGFLFLATTRGEVHCLESIAKETVAKD
ncbi:MAG: PQQ-binding-like beta-propeller repeat protein [Pirellulaceae bacterium]|nr:PQQ-binding-like beta-propeller repeat protein [Pirellulaceae bacterium]